MGSKTKTTQTPYQQNTTSNYQWFDPSSTEAGKQLAAWEPQVDPGIQARSDLAQQENSNRWDNDFVSGLPMHIRMRLRDSSERQIRQGANLERQGGEYAKNQLELQKRGMLLPRLAQTGGTSQGYGTQVYQTPSMWGSILGAAGQVGSAAILASDERVKNVRGEAPVGLEEVSQLQPAQYQYKPEAGIDEGREHQGLVAQDVEQVMPEAVVEDEQGLKGVDQEALIAALINSMKELNQKVDALSGQQQPAPTSHRPMGGMNGLQ